MVENLYIKAFLLSLGVFCIGLFIGISVEKFIISDIREKTSDVESFVHDIELEMFYFQNLNESYSCDFLNEIIRRTNNNLDILAEQLSSYSENNVIATKKDVEYVRKKYTSLLIKDWLLQEKIKKTCDAKTVTILYFYDREGCNDCVVQGNVLSSLKYSFAEKLMIFPLDTRVDVPMIVILKNRFNTTLVPSLVIEEKTYSGIISQDQLKNIVCNIILDENITACH